MARNVGSCCCFCFGTIQRKEMVLLEALKEGAKESLKLAMVAGDYGICSLKNLEGARLGKAGLPSLDCATFLIRRRKKGCHNDQH